MPFTLNWSEEATEDYETLKSEAEAVRRGRTTRGKSKSSKAEGLFNQVNKALRFLRENPRHPGLNTHEYHSLENPISRDEKVWEAYAQNQTPGAYRIFWCYGPGKGVITIIAIIPHP
jgi:hypothetical protein